MKIIAFFVCLLSAALSLGQSQPYEFYAAGSSFNHNGSPAIAGTALYAREVNTSSGTFAFSVFDVLTTNTKPLNASTNIGVGLAQKAITIGKIVIYLPTSAGVSVTGPNTGWNWSTGMLASISVGKKGYKILPMFRVLKASVNNGTGYQPVFGLLIGKGSGK